MTASNPFRLNFWLLLVVVILCAGCGQTAVVLEEPPPAAVDVRFERLPTLVAGIQDGGDVVLYEGLPDSFWEPDLRGQELKRKKTVRHHGYPFYEEPRTLQKTETSQLTACLAALDSFSAYSGLKNSGEYNSDYCLVWTTSGGETHALVSLECKEVKLYGPQSELHCDLSPAAAQQLKQLLEPFRKNRPVKDASR